MSVVERVAGPRIVVALDFPEPAAVLGCAERLDPELCRVKIGLEAFLAGDPRLIETLIGRRFDVFLDLKLHDIPNTVHAAVARACDLGVWMLTVHAAGGRAMLAAAREAAAGAEAPPLVVAVTVLTSLSGADLAETGARRALAEQVVHLARLARAVGLDGIVCSAREAARLRSALGREMWLVTPGIRPQGSAGETDQKRITTPREAVGAGADYLVIGRPITRAQDPAQALATLVAELRSAPETIHR